MNAAEFAASTLAPGRIAVCVGCGGVGKTSVAAALALEAARRGLRTLVLTIDPARRLADALGVGELGNEPQQIPRETLAALGVPEQGRLAALMLDMKRTFDDLVERFAENESVRQRILENRIYQHASDALAGSVEYSAMEKVYELWEGGEYDLIVVDTPPAQHALDFLDAPQRLLEFLDSRLVQLLIHPAFAAGRLGFRLFQQGTQWVMQVMERLSGIGFLQDLSEFLLAFEGMSEGFRERATRVRALLLGPQSSFVLVSATGRESVQQAEDFCARLESQGVKLQAVLVNRVRLWPDGTPPSTLARDAEIDPADLQRLAAALQAAGGTEFPAETAARAAIEAAKGYAALVRRDARATQALQQGIETRGSFWGRIPEFADEVHDLSGLKRIADSIFTEEAAVAEQA